MFIYLQVLSGNGLKETTLAVLIYSYTGPAYVHSILLRVGENAAILLIMTFDHRSFYSFFVTSFYISLFKALSLTTVHHCLRNNFS